jgi:hypothetical protein
VVLDLGLRPRPSLTYRDRDSCRGALAMEACIMDRVAPQSSEVLLARLNHEVERISALQHRLARRKAVVQEQITRLRLGVSPTEVRLALKTIGVGEHENRRRWNADPEPLPRGPYLPHPSPAFGVRPFRRSGG